jgi:FMN reductase
VFAAAEDWAGGDRTSGALDERIRRAAGELAGLIAGRQPAAPADPFDAPFGGTPSFAALLRGV